MECLKRGLPIIMSKLITAVQPGTLASPKEQQFIVVETIKQIHFIFDMANSHYQTKVQFLLGIKLKDFMRVALGRYIFSQISGVQGNVSFAYFQNSPS